MAALCTFDDAISMTLACKLRNFAHKPSMMREASSMKPQMFIVKSGFTNVHVQQIKAKSVLKWSDQTKLHLKHSQMSAASSHMKA
jgi:hypothetical protein